MTGNREVYSADEVARAWLVKMHGEEAAALRSEFVAWRDAAPENGDAWNRVSAQWREAGALKQSARFGTAQAERRRTRSWRAVMTPGAITIALLLAVGTGAFMTLVPNGSGVSTARAAERFTTTRGEIRTFALGDSAAATLDTDSRIDVLANGPERHIRVVSGRTRIRSWGKGIPLRVEAGGATIVAEEAELDISIASGGDVRIYLLRGTARFEGNRASGAPADLPVGQPFGLSSRGEFWIAAGVSQDHAADWPAGWAEYGSIPLGALVREANRYAARPIRIDDPSVARLKLSGRFHISETAQFSQRIAELFDLQLEHRSDGIHLSRKKTSLPG